MKVSRLFAISPVFRLTAKLNTDFTPYIETGLDAAYLSDDRLGHRDLGSQFAFHWAGRAGFKPFFQEHFMQIFG